MELQLSIAESQLASERARTARLQDALDELCEDLARESYGRRREVALRLALLSREEAVAEFIRRWARRARELYARYYNSAQPSAPHEDAVQNAFHRVVSDAESILSTLDDDLQFSDGTRASGSMARIALSRAAVDALRSELQDEMQKRLEAVRKSALLLPNDHLEGTDDRVQPEYTPSQTDQVLLTPSGDADSEHAVELPQSRVADSPMSTAGPPHEAIDDPFVVSTSVALPVAESTERTISQAISSPSIQDSASTSATLLVEEEPKAVQSHSPAMSMLDLREDLQPFSTEEPPTIHVVPIHTFPSDISVSDTQVLAEEELKSVQSHSPAVSMPDLQEDLQPSEQPPTTDAVSLLSDTSISDAQVFTADNTSIPTSISTPLPTTSLLAPDPSPTNIPPTLLSELGATKHRYNALQRAFRDCSLALKELKRTLAPSSPSPPTQTKLRHHLETALVRIDDYAEDARVELEIRVADEELTLRGFEMVLSVRGALVDADERAEVEASASAFVDGTDEGVARALDRFGRKLEDVQHDVAVVKRAVHGLAMEGGEDREGEERGEEGERKDAGWTAWTAGLLGGTPMRSPTPAETFGTVMTSPRLRHAASLKQLHAGAQEGTSDAHGPLAELNLRIPMPVAEPTWMQIGVGRPEGAMRPRTLSAMYAVGGLRSSSVGLGVGLGGSPSPARTRGVSGLGVSSPLRARSSHVDDIQDLGGVE